ncbi:hypothetical protein C8Q77DRAFT_1159765 [Trametes polyzona]|nr:hypothetical protein C8Q77DRAFT_1159765 [Trametes polyzona]
MSVIVVLPSRLATATPSRGRKPGRAATTGRRGRSSSSFGATSSTFPTATATPTTLPDFEADIPLKLELVASPTIVSYSCADGLSVVPYPCNDDGDPIPVQQLWYYNQHHRFLDNISCFCEFRYGTRRPVRIIKARSVQHGGSICLGCPDWLPSGRDLFGNPAGCRYFVNLDHVFSGSTPWAQTPLQPYPEREGIYISPTRLPSSQGNRTTSGSSEVAAGDNTSNTSPASVSLQSSPSARIEWASPAIASSSAGGWGTASPSSPTGDPSDQADHYELQLITGSCHGSSQPPCSQPAQTTHNLGDDSHTIEGICLDSAPGNGDRAPKRRRTLGGHVVSVPGTDMRARTRSLSPSPPVPSISAAIETLTAVVTALAPSPTTFGQKASTLGPSKMPAASLKRKATYAPHDIIEVSSGDEDVASTRPPSATIRPLLVAQERRMGRQEGSSTFRRAPLPMKPVRTGNASTGSSSSALSLAVPSAPRLAPCAAAAQLSARTTIEVPRALEATAVTAALDLPLSLTSAIEGDRSPPSAASSTSSNEPPALLADRRPMHVADIFGPPPAPVHSLPRRLPTRSRYHQVAPGLEGPYGGAPILPHIPYAMHPYTARPYVPRPYAPHPYMPHTPPPYAHLYGMGMIPPLPHPELHPRGSAPSYYARHGFYDYGYGYGGHPREYMTGPAFEYMDAPQPSLVSARGSAHNNHRPPHAMEATSEEAHAQRHDRGVPDHAGIPPVARMPLPADAMGPSEPRAPTDGMYAPHGGHLVPSSAMGTPTSPSTLWTTSGSAQDARAPFEDSAVFPAGLIVATRDAGPSVESRTDAEGADDPGNLAPSNVTH